MITEYRKDSSPKTEASVSNTESENIGIKPFRCLIEEMIASEANDHEIFSQIGTMMIAGQDTVSLAIQMLIVHLCENSNEQTRCREEVDDLFDSKSECDRAILTMEDLFALKHLERCVFETLRITPIIPVFSRYLKEPFKLTESLELPKGSSVFISPWGLHHNPKYFPNPDKFEPDRFLPEAVKSRHPYSYLPFSSGNRNCVGKILYIVANILTINKPNEDVNFILILIQVINLPL